MSDGAGKAKMTDNAREGGARSTTGSRITRRTFLKGAVSLGVASLGAPLLWQAPALAARKVPGAGATAAAASSYIKHVIVYSQENRSFDHYYGYASAIKNDPQFAKWAIPDGYYQPNGRKKVVPWHFTTRSTPDVGHSWTSVHGEWNNGKMDGFYKTDGMNAMGYYTQDPTKNIDDLLFYYGLFNDSAALCVNYFCSVLGPTYPNRFYFVGGTSGGITTNGIYGYGKLDWQIILDLLEPAGVSWKVYNIDQFTDDPVSTGESDNVFAFFKRWAPDSNHIDPRLTASKQDYLNDLRSGNLPNVSFIIDSYTKNYDEHPGFNTDIWRGMNLQKELIDALRASTSWQNSAYILTYDEHGGFFDHVAPPVLDAYGAGMRVPTWVISPYAKQSPNLVDTRYEHSSILKFIEKVFGLPTLASKNSNFDSSTPTGTNYQTKGKPAPPRDGLPDSTVGNLSWSASPSRHSALADTTTDRIEQKTPPHKTATAIFSECLM